MFSISTQVSQYWTSTYAHTMLILILILHFIYTIKFFAQNIQSTAYLPYQIVTFTVDRKV